MKKTIPIFIASIMLAFSCFACGNSSVQGEYRKYEMDTEVYSMYYSMTLKKGNYVFEEVTVANKTATSDVKSKGKYSLSDKNTIAFTENSTSYTFEGTVEDGKLYFRYKAIEYYLSK